MDGRLHLGEVHVGGGPVSLARLVVRRRNLTIGNNMSLSAQQHVREATHKTESLLCTVVALSENVGQEAISLVTS